MRKLFIFSILMIVSCAYAYASDIAFYVGSPNIDGWYTADAMLEDVETIKNESGELFEAIGEFNDDELGELADWAEARIDDDKLDIIWLNGCVCPAASIHFPTLSRMIRSSNAGWTAEIWS